ncbi:tandem large repeat, partial [Vibrio lentus]|uniref:tandem large repeat n=1 Tax=Vibrio lentus TaxID=136468 RepID=UPI0039A6E4E9
SETFTLTQSLAELDADATSVAPEEADVGGVVTVTAVFTKAVSKPTTATLGSNTVVWTSTGAALQTWVGKVAALTASDTEQVLSLTINGFSDELGNAGQEQTKAAAVKVTPVIQVTEPGDVTDSNISAMNFSGTTKRFENSAALTLTITPLGSDTPVAGVPAETVTVTDGQWQSGAMDLSGLSNAEYRVLVTGENTTGVTVSGSETFTLTQSLAELDADATSVAPEEADVGGVVTVTAVFTKAVSKPTTATLGSNTVVWTSTGAALQTWVGKVAALTASDTEQVLSLTINGFSDELGNAGQEQTKAAAVKVTPVIQVTEPGDVTDSNISVMNFSGTTKRFENSAALTLTITPLGSDTPVAGVPAETVTVTDGQWQSGTMNLSGLSNAEYRVLVTGENTTGVTVSDSETFTLTQSLAELDADATSVAPEEADVGGVVTVTAVFTKAVSKPTTATLGSNTVVWTSTGAALQTWVGKVAALTASDTEQVLSLTINGFSDELGNAGQEQTKAAAVKVTPVIQVTEPGDVTDSNISAMNFSGTTKRFENSAALTLTITPLGSDTPVAGVPAETVTVTDGQWQSGTMNLSGLSNAEYRVLVTGENTTGVTVSGSETFTLTQSLAELDADATSVAPEEADVGGVVTVTAVFTKAVSKPTTATLGSNTVVWTSTGAALQTWVGKVAALTASDTEQVLSLTINGFSDELGNAGQEQTKAAAVKVTPVIQVTEPGDVTDSNISAMNFSGTTKRFENSAALTLTITPLGSDTPVAGVPAETVTVTDGQWQSGTMNLSGLSNAEYRVLVTGENTAGVTVS